MIPKFDLGQDFHTLQPATKFNHPMFNHSEVIALTNKQSNAAENITSVRYSTPVGNEQRTTEVLVGNIVLSGVVLVRDCLV